MSTGKVLLGAMIALGAGAALGVLFAPDKGSTTRKKLSQEASRFAGALKTTAGEYVDTLEEKFVDARKSAVGLTDRMNGAMDALAGHEPRTARR